MRIVVLSDTHANQVQDLPEKIVEATSTADLIIHAGDFAGDHRISLGGGLSTAS